MNVWMNEIENYIKKEKVNLYGEDAFNTISDKINLLPMFSNDFCMEIDNQKDLFKARKYFRENGSK